MLDEGVPRVRTPLPRRRLGLFGVRPLARAARPPPAFAPDARDAAESYDAACFSRLALLEAGNFWFEARNRLLIWALRRYFATATSFLEIGCGTGFVLAGIQRALPALALPRTEIFSEDLMPGSGCLAPPCPDGRPLHPLRG